MKISISIEDASPEMLRMLSTFVSPVSAKPARGTPANFTKGKWSDEEKAAILDVPESEAWNNYHRLFPNSVRSKSAVWRKRFELAEKDPVEKEPLGKITPIVAPAVTPVETIHAKIVSIPRKPNPYGIPSALYNSDTKLYNRLSYRCKKLGILYDEALAMEDTSKPVQTHTRKPNPVVPHQELTLNSKVRQTGNGAMTGIGTVVKIQGDEVLARFDNGAMWVRKENLVSA